MLRAMIYMGLQRVLVLGGLFARLAQDGATACLLSRIFGKYRQIFIPWRTTGHRAGRGHGPPGLRRNRSKSKKWRMPVSKKASSFVQDMLRSVEITQFKKQMLGIARFREIRRAGLASNQRSAWVGCEERSA